MTILYPAPTPVKSARRFGQGILPTHPSYRAPFASADLEWLIADNARRARLDRHYDQLAAQSHALSLMEAGIPCC